MNAEQLIPGLTIVRELPTAYGEGDKRPYRKLEIRDDRSDPALTRHAYVFENLGQRASAEISKNLELLMTQPSLPHVSVPLERGKAGGKFFVITATSNGSLRARLTNQGLPGRNAWTLFKQIVEGVKELHDLGVAHGELRADTIQISPNNDKAWISDAAWGGLVYWSDGKFVTDETKKVVPPELNGKLPASPSKAADVYALGRIAFKMLVGSEPSGGAAERKRQLKGARVSRSKRSLLLRILAAEDRRPADARKVLRLLIRREKMPRYLFGAVLCLLPVICLLVVFLAYSAKNGDLAKQNSDLATEVERLRKVEQSVGGLNTEKQTQEQLIEKLKKRIAELTKAPRGPHDSQRKRIAQLLAEKEESRKLLPFKGDTIDYEKIAEKEWHFLVSSESDPGEMLKKIRLKPAHVREYLVKWYDLFETPPHPQNYSHWFVRPTRARLGEGKYGKERRFEVKLNGSDPTDGQRAIGAHNWSDEKQHEYPSDNAFLNDNSNWLKFRWQPGDHITIQLIEPWRLTSPGSRVIREENFTGPMALWRLATTGMRWREGLIEFQVWELRGVPAVK